MADMLDKQINSYIRKLRKIKNVEVLRANASALNKGTRTIRAKSLKAISAETRVPQKLLRKRIFSNKATAKKQSAQIKSFIKPVSASSLLTKNQINNKLGTGTNRRGVTAKGYKWQGAFIQRGKNENLHVFRRKGKKRLPLEVIKVPIDASAQRVLPKVARRFMKTGYPRLLKQDLKFRLSKYEVR